MYIDYINPYYNPTDTTPKPGENKNWEDIQRGFYRIGVDVDDLKITVIEVVANTQDDETQYTIVDYNNVKSKIGKFIEYPQILVLRDSDNTNYHIFYPVAYTAGEEAISAQFASLRTEYYEIGGVSCVYNDVIGEWGIIVQPFN